MTRRKFLKDKRERCVWLCGRRNTKAYRVEQDRKASARRAAWAVAGTEGKTDLFLLIQVAPREVVVGLCELWDSKAGRAGRSGRPTPAIQKENHPCLGNTAHCWPKRAGNRAGGPPTLHCLAMIEACKGGRGSGLGLCPKRSAMTWAKARRWSPAARKYKRTVSRWDWNGASTPHILEAREISLHSRAAKLGKIAYVDIHSYPAAKKFPGGRPRLPSDTGLGDVLFGPARPAVINPGIHPRGGGPGGGLGLAVTRADEFSQRQIGDLCGPPVRCDEECASDLRGPGAFLRPAALMRDPTRAWNVTTPRRAYFDLGDVKVVWTHAAMGPESGEPD